MKQPLATTSRAVVLIDHKKLQQLLIMITYYLSSNSRFIGNITYTTSTQIIPAFDKLDIRRNLHRHRSSGIVTPYSFDRPKNRFAMLGMSGRAYQNGFTVACGFTHRRAWQVFLQSQFETALILEDDAKCNTSRTGLQKIIKTVGRLDITWNFIQLGRCWDFCQSQQLIYATTTMKFLKSESPCCSHAYIINRKGARILLHYSLPHMTSIDLLITLLSRMNVLNLYSISPPLCNQTRNDFSHDDTILLECDPNETNLRKTLRHRDEFAFSLIKSSWVHDYTGFNSEVSNLLQKCKFPPNCIQIRGTLQGKHVFPQYSITSLFKQMNIQSIVLWNKVKNYDYCHVQEAIHDTLRDILKYDNEKRSLCWITSGQNCTTFFENSLVFVAPREEIWSHDKALKRLGYHPSNMYIFYGTVPYRFRRYRNWIQLSISGESMHIIDSLDFITHKMNMLYAADQFSRAREIRVQTAITFAYDVPKPLFCKFVEECQITITKIGFGKHKCKKAYTYLRHQADRHEKQFILQKNAFQPVLAYKNFVHPIFFQAALNAKLIFTNSQHLKNQFDYSNVVFENTSTHFCKNYRTIKYDTQPLQVLIKHKHLYVHRIHDIMNNFVELRSMNKTYNQIP